jgi:hypothetical protein
MKKSLGTFLLFAFILTGCAGFGRSCSSWNAENFGSDWIIVQYGMDGTPINCWKLVNVSVTNETGSDGIYWKDSETSHLIHISGWYNRVQVADGRFKEAADLVGVKLEYVKNGKYVVPK